MASDESDQEIQRLKQAISATKNGYLTSQNIDTILNWLFKIKGSGIIQDNELASKIDDKIGYFSSLALMQKGGNNGFR